MSYDSSEALESFLTSLHAHHGSHLAVAVVDNKPEGASSVEKVAGSHHATYVPLPKNPGYGAGMNAGVLALREEYGEFDAYFFCNPDVMFTEPALPELAIALMSDPAAGSIGPRTLNEDGTVYPSARGIPSISTGVGHALFGRVWPGNPWSRAYKNESDYGARRATGWLSGAAVMVKRSVNDEIGGWDEGYFLHFEDIDLGYRIGLAGYSNVFDPAVTIIHSGGHSLKKNSVLAERAMTRSSIRFMNKRYAGFWRTPLRWAIVLGLQLRGWLKVRAAQRR